MMLFNLKIKFIIRCLRSFVQERVKLSFTWIHLSTRGLIRAPILKRVALAGCPKGSVWPIWRDCKSSWAASSGCCSTSWAPSSACCWSWTGPGAASRGCDGSCPQIEDWRCSVPARSWTGDSGARMVTPTPRLATGKNCLAALPPHCDLNFFGSHLLCFLNECSLSSFFGTFYCELSNSVDADPGYHFFICSDAQCEKELPLRSLFRGFIIWKSEKCYEDLTKCQCWLWTRVNE